MPDTYLAACVLVTTWGSALVVLVGVGLIALRVLGLRMVNGAAFVAASFVGFSVFVGVAQVLHIVWPADGRLWLLAALAGAVGWYGYRGKLDVRPPRSRLTGGLLIVAVVVVAHVGLIAAQQRPQVDTGSYHLPAVLWSRAHPVVPGLANLHGRLGFNSSFPLFAASFAHGPFRTHPHSVAIGPLVLMNLGLFAVGLSGILVGRRPTASNVFAVVISVPVWMIARRHLGDLDANSVMHLLAFGGVWLLVRGFDPDESPGLNHAFRWAALIVLLGACTVKLTAWPLLGLTAFVLWPSRSMRPSVTALAAAALLTAVFLVPWAARGVVTSGYPAYPVPVLGFDVDWRVHPDQIQAELDWVRSHSRRSFERPPEDLRWLGRWWTFVTQPEQLWAVPVPAGLCMVALVALYALRRRSEAPPGEARFLGIATVTALAVIAWFVSAPSYRLGRGQIWIAAALFITAAFLRGASLSPRALRGGLAVLGLGWALWMAGSIGLSPPPHARTSDADFGLQDRIVAGLRTIETRRQPYTTRSGLVVEVPIKGMPWAAPLLTTRHPTPGLRLRDPNDLSAGFANDLDWEPYEFPHWTLRKYQGWLRRKLGEQRQVREHY